MSQLAFKDLKKRVSSELAQQQSRLFGRLQNKPFGFGMLNSISKEHILGCFPCCSLYLI
ncbi:MAG: hypothetical protein ACJ71G_12220 [Nitrososphaeraceae archaeon]